MGSQNTCKIAKGHTIIENSGLRLRRNCLSLEFNWWIGWIETQSILFLVWTMY